MGLFNDLKNRFYSNNPKYLLDKLLEGSPVVKSNFNKADRTLKDQLINYVSTIKPEDLKDVMYKQKVIAYIKSMVEPRSVSDRLKNFKDKMAASNVNQKLVEAKEAVQDKARTIKAQARLTKESIQGFKDKLVARQFADEVLRSLLNNEWFAYFQNTNRSVRKQVLGYVASLDQDLLNQDHAYRANIIEYITNLMKSLQKQESARRILLPGSGPGGAQDIAKGLIKTVKGVKNLKAKHEEIKEQAREEVRVRRKEEKDKTEFQQRFADKFKDMNIGPTSGKISTGSSKPTINKLKFCPVCGAKVDPKLNYCTHCGAKLI